MYVRIIRQARAVRIQQKSADCLSFRIARLQAAKGPHEIGDRRADLSRTVFLNEMDALHSDFRLIRPSAAKLALTAMVERARLRMEIKFRHLALREPLTVVADNLHYIGRFTVERNLARPG